MTRLLLVLAALVSVLLVAGQLVSVPAVEVRAESAANLEAGRIPALSEPPLLVPTAAAVPTETAVVALRMVEPVPVEITTGQFYLALARSPWPRALWPELVRIARCEAPLGEGVDAAAEGDGGRALGALQVRADVHTDLARDYDLLSVDGVLAAAWAVYVRAGGNFRPWSCS